MYPKFIRNIIGPKKKISEKVVNKKIILNIIFILFIYLLLYIINSSIYFKVDFRTEDDIKAYLQKYIKNTYNVNSTLTLNDKSLIEFSCFFDFDGCRTSGGNINVYDYDFSGIDENGKAFSISYRNSYIKNLQYNKFGIYEDYFIYEQNNKINEYLSSFVEYFKIYTSRESESHHILIYIEKFKEQALLDIYDKIETFSDSSSYSILFVNDLASYRKLLIYRNKYSNWPGIESFLGYKKDKTEEIKYYDTFNTNFLMDMHKVVVFEEGIGTKSISLYY